MASRYDILVVGVCGAGKTTLVQGLRAVGYAARSCVQEHSFVPGLWRRHGRPDALIYLHASLVTVCRRLNVQWSEEALALQYSRLAEARWHCDLYLDTDPLSIEEVRVRVVAYLRARHLEPGKGTRPEAGAYPKTAGRGR